MKHWNILWDCDECAIISLCVCNILLYVCNNLWCVCEISWCVCYNLVHLGAVSCDVCAIILLWMCNMYRQVLLRTPSPVPLRTCICSTCWDQPFSRTCRYFPENALRTALGTFSILFGHIFNFTKYIFHFKYTKILLLRCIHYFKLDMDNMRISGTTLSSVIHSQRSF